MGEVLQDLKIGWRSLWRNPGFAVVALLTLGIGIGANAAIFSYIDGAMLRPPPFPNGGRIVMISLVNPEHRAGKVSAQDFVELERQSTVFETMTAHEWNTAPFSNGEAPIELPNEWASLHFFDVFRQRPQLGRVFAPGEDQPGRNHVAVLSHVCWMTEFGGDPGIIGRTFRLGGEIYTVIGVMPAGAFDRTSTRLWRPISFAQLESDRQNRGLTCWGSLKPGVSVETAQAELATIVTRLARVDPQLYKDCGIQVDRFASVLISPEIRRSLFTLMGAVFLVLIIACANLANLTLARANARQKEVAIRSALGAGRGRLFRQFLTESLMLSLGGGVPGLGIAYAGIEGLRLVVPGKYLPANVYVAMDGRILGFIFALSVLSGIAFGLYPALQAARGGLAASLQQSGRSASSDRSSRTFRSLLVVVEISLAFVLLNGAGLLIRSFFNLQHVDVGFDAQDLLTGWLPTAPLRLKDGVNLSNHAHQIVERVRAIPGVTAAAVSMSVPLLGSGGVDLPFSPDGLPPSDASRLPHCSFNIVTPSYFQTLGLHLRAGRVLNEHDTMAGERVVVVNETLATKYFPNRNPIGQRLLVPTMAFGGIGPGATDWQIVGVVGDEKDGELNALGERRARVIATVDQAPLAFQALLVRTQGEPRRYLRQITDALAQVNSEQRLLYPQTLAEIKDRSMGDQRLHSLLLSIFAAIAVGLSALGLYGVISYSVGQRTREIGIRAALGATRTDILWLLLRGALILSGVGLLIGYAGTLALGQILQTLLFQVGRYDPSILVSVAGLLATMMLVASLVPAQRAATVNPVEALRHD